MRLVVVSPAQADSREREVLEGLLAAGLSRYHLRKPGWSLGALAAWIEALPAAWRPRLVVHGPEILARALGLGGAHARDGGLADGARGRSCHDLAGLRAALPGHDTLFFGPVFPSITKPGHGPDPAADWASLGRVLAGRGPADARVLAIGGVTAERLGRCRELGFDGAALLGAVWAAPDPVGAFRAAAAAAEGPGAVSHAA